jgi:hypothetical protein
MAQTCTTVTDVWWNGLGAALVGGFTAAIVATAVVLGTRSYERRHVKEQEARAAARELLKDTDTYLHAISDALTNSSEDRKARQTAHWRWLSAAQVAQGSVQAVSPELAERIVAAATRSGVAVELVGSLIGPAGDEAWKSLMEEALPTITDPPLALQQILAHWVGTGKVLDLDDEPREAPA